MDRQYPHDERYDRADEFTEIVTRLWESWEPDAIRLDRENNVFADGQKVHAIQHEGRFFKVRGPLNAPRSPQVRPVLCQAGGVAARPGICIAVGGHYHRAFGERGANEGFPP